VGSFNHPGAQEQGNCREQEMVHAPLTREIISVVDIPKAAHLALQVIAQARKAVLASSQEVETTAQPRTWNQGTISSGDTPPGWENSISHGKCKKWIEDNIQSWFHHANQGILSR